jgi:type IV secretion system protein VirB1
VEVHHVQPDHIEHRNCTAGIMIGLAAALALVHRCAPAVAPETLLSVVQVESRFDPLAIGLNGRGGGSISSTTQEEATSKATALLAAGRNFDLGIAQINSRNLAWLGLSVEQAFDPCANLAAAARILQSDYALADAQRAGPQAALRTTLSLYNTGHPVRGITNGYVDRVTAAAAQIVPSLGVGPDQQPVPMPHQQSPAWDVFGQAAGGRSSFVISISTQTTGTQQ